MLEGAGREHDPPGVDRAVRQGEQEAPAVGVLGEVDHLGVLAHRRLTARRVLLDDA